MKMTIEQFIHAYQIQPADAIVVKKEELGILDHYVIYLGVDSLGEYKFIANYTKGIAFLSADEILNFLRLFVPVRLNRFIGSEYDRNMAVNRALTRLNENAYNLILNNCEHFANWVQKGLPKSDQVETFGQVLAMVGIGISILSKDTDSVGAGLFMAGLGALLINSSQQK